MVIKIKIESKKAVLCIHQLTSAMMMKNTLYIQIDTYTNTKPMAKNKNDRLSSSSLSTILFYLRPVFTLCTCARALQYDMTHTLHSLLGVFRQEKTTYYRRWQNINLNSISSLERYDVVFSSVMNVILILFQYSYQSHSPIFTLDFHNAVHVSRSR